MKPRSKPLNFYHHSSPKNAKKHTSAFNGSHVEKRAIPVASEKTGNEEEKILNINMFLPEELSAQLKNDPTIKSSEKTKNPTGTDKIRQMLK